MSETKRKRGDLTPDATEAEIITWENYSSLSDEFIKAKNDLAQYITTSRDAQAKKSDMFECLNKMESVFLNVTRAYSALSANKTVSDELSSIKQLLSELPKTIEPIVSSSASRSTYADVVSIPMSRRADRVKTPAGKTITPTKRSAVMIMPKEGNTDITTSDATKSTLMKHVNPSALGLQLDKVRLTSKCGVRIESTSDIANSIPFDVLDKVGLVLKPVGKMRPRMSIVGVPSDLPASEVKNAIISQNFTELSENERLALQDDIEVKFRFGARDQPYCNWVVELGPTSRTKLKAKERIYISWSACRIYDHIRVLRCYKCQKLGHLAEKCQSEQQCGHCAGKHETKNCDKKDSVPKCANCERAGHSGEVIQHKASSNNCPMYAKRVEAKILNTDYGS